MQAVKELAIKLKLNVGKGGLVAFAEELLSEMKKVPSRLVNFLELWLCAITLVRF